MKPRVAVIGGGWAGCAAALTLAEADLDVTLFEAAGVLGGRARGLEIHGLVLDNGQHLLLGAYVQTLALIAAVSPSGRRDAGLLRLPLALDQPPDFSLVCPKLPAPFHVLMGLAAARGLKLSEKWSAARWVHHLLHASVEIDDISVAQLIADQPQKVCAALWQPLCIAALNTPIEAASAKIFRQVLRAALGKKRSHSDLLFPRVDLTQLFPQPATERVKALHGQVLMQTRVTGMTTASSKVMLTTREQADAFDRVIVAVAPQHVAKLCSAVPQLAETIETVEAYHYEAIATTYLQYPEEVRLLRPMLGLSGEPAQFVFDRGYTHGQAGLLAVVASAASNLSAQTQSEWIVTIQQQLRTLGVLSAPLWHKTIFEKEASYSCRIHLPRPENRTPHPAIFLAGDYTAGDYPATLESATRSGVKSAQMLINSL